MTKTNTHTPGPMEIIRAFVIAEGDNCGWRIPSLVMSALQNHAVRECLDTYYHGMELHTPTGRYDRKSGPWNEATQRIRKYVRSKKVRFEAARAALKLAKRE